MRKYFINIFIILAVIMGVFTNVYAEENENACSSIEKNELVKLASNVTATYEYVYNNINEVIGFNYIVYNVPNNMYVTISGIPDENGDELETSEVLEIDDETGIGKYYDENLTETYKVYFSVYSSTGGCRGILKSVYVQKVKYNPFSDLEQCSYEGMEDFIYCQKWVDKDFIYSDAVIVDKINKQLNKNQGKTVTICYSCEENEKNNDIYETIVKIRFYAIIGLSIGIVIDLIVIVVSFRKVEEYEL